MFAAHSGAKTDRRVVNENRAARRCVANAVACRLLRLSMMRLERDSKTDELLRRIRGEFLEMPGMRLTRMQARRLWGLDARLCDMLLDALVEARFLLRTSDGAFISRQSSVVSHQ